MSIKRVLNNKKAVLRYKENVRFDTTTTVITTVGNQGTGNTVITRTYLGTSSTDIQDVTARGRNIKLR